jgi:hypothetical protein
MIQVLQPRASHSAIYLTFHRIGCACEYFFGAWSTQTDLNFLCHQLTPLPPGKSPARGAAKFVAYNPTVAAGIDRYSADRSANVEGDYTVTGLMERGYFRLLHHSNLLPKSANAQKCAAHGRHSHVAALKSDLPGWKRR